MPWRSKDLFKESSVELGIMCLKVQSSCDLQNTVCCVFFAKMLNREGKMRERRGGGGEDAKRQGEEERKEGRSMNGSVCLSCTIAWVITEPSNLGHFLHGCVNK